MDPEQLGCLLNNGAQQKSLMKEYCVQNSIVTFMQAMKISLGFKDGVPVP
jgi:hypothetical protein